MFANFLQDGRSKDSLHSHMRRLLYHFPSIWRGIVKIKLFARPLLRALSTVAGCCESANRFLDIFTFLQCSFAYPQSLLFGKYHKYFLDVFWLYFAKFACRTQYGKCKCIAFYTLGLNTWISVVRLRVITHFRACLITWQTWQMSNIAIICVYCCYPRTNGMHSLYLYNFLCEAGTGCGSGAGAGVGAGTVGIFKSKLKPKRTGCFLGSWLETGVMQKIVQW